MTNPNEMPDTPPFSRSQWAVDEGFPTSKWEDFDWDAPGVFGLLSQGYRRCEECAFWVAAAAADPWVVCAGCAAEEARQDRLRVESPERYCCQCTAALSEYELLCFEEDGGEYWGKDDRLCDPCESGPPEPPDLGCHW